MKNYRNLGISSEYVLIAFLIENNFNVLKPVIDTHYDLAIANKNSLLKIQCKSVDTITKDDRKGNRYSALVCKDLKNKKVLYTKDEVDIIAIHIRDLNVWYFIPVEEIKTKRISLWPQVVNSKEQFLKYKNNIQVLK